MSPCHCTEVPILWATEADTYAGSHLVVEETHPDGRTRLRCMATGRLWMQDHPLDDLGVPTLRLRWVDTSPSDVIAYLAGQPGLEQYMLTMDPEVEHQPLPDAPVLHGLRELRDYTARYLSEEHPPRSAALSVVDREQDALVLGHVSHNRGGKYVEHRPAAWIVTVRDARVTRVRAFDNWSRARREAGMEAVDAAVSRRLRTRPAFS